MLITISVLITGVLLILYLLFGAAVKTNNVENIRIRKNWTLQQLSDTLQRRAG
ncbi:MAG: hypothetical protein RLZZ161_963, partial [Bacteroidota bacterium]